MAVNATLPAVALVGGLNLPPTLMIPFGINVTRLILDVFIIALVVCKWDALGFRFRQICLACCAFDLCTTSTAIAYLAQLNTLSACIVSRKLIYTFNDCTFFLFDIYQCLRISAIAKPSARVLAGLYALLALRLCVSVYLVTAVTAGVAVLPGNPVSVPPMGPCTTQIVASAIFLDHTVSLVFELALVLTFLLFVRDSLQSELADFAAWVSFVKKMVDFEMAGFGLYFLFDCVQRFVPYVHSVSRPSRSCSVCVWCACRLMASVWLPFLPSHANLCRLRHCMAQSVVCLCRAVAVPGQHRQFLVASR